MPLFSNLHSVQPGLLHCDGGWFYSAGGTEDWHSRRTSDCHTLHSGGISRRYALCVSLKYVTHVICACFCFCYHPHFTDSDFTPIIDFPVTFGSSEFEKRITIQTNSDDIVEGVETLTAQLTPISDRVIITGDTADISIEETDNGIYI